jgi:transcriptional regulator with XRE-family HTH domain
MKRSQQKRIGIEAKVLRFMRQSRGISQKQAAIKCSVSEQAVGHYENGRMDVSPLRLARFLEVYGYAFSEYEEFVIKGKTIPVLSIKQECIHLLEKVDEAKLRTVLSVLQGFTQ